MSFDEKLERSRMEKSGHFHVPNIIHFIFTLFAHFHFHPDIYRERIVGLFSVYDIFFSSVMDVSMKNSCAINTVKIAYKL